MYMFMHVKNDRRIAHASTPRGGPGYKRTDIDKVGSSFESVVSKHLKPHPPTVHAKQSTLVYGSIAADHPASVCGPDHTLNAVSCAVLRCACMVQAHCNTASTQVYMYILP